MRAVVVGGGLAGITAALDLAAAGVEVTLLERSGQLGGLCRSVPDPVAGRVDTGQHVYLGCCTELEGLLGRLGIQPALRQDRLELTVVDPGRPRPRRLSAAPLPAPFHLLPVLGRWPNLPRGSTLHVARVAAALRDGPGGLDTLPALGWLRGLGQPEQLISQLWEPFLVAACNAPLDRCSAELAAFVVREGLLSSARAGALRVPGTDLTRWLDPPARQALESAGVEIRLDSRVLSVSGGPKSQLRVTHSSGADEAFDLAALAVPARSAHRLLLAGGRSSTALEEAAGIPDSPIVNVHLFTDRPFLPGAVTLIPRSPLQWAFDRSQLDDQPLDGSWHAAVSISAAKDEVAVPEARLAADIWQLCRATFPPAARARLLHSRVTREAHATFWPEPGSAARRPGPDGAIPKVALAGSWTRTGWPATMEGAVRSGRAAARHLLA
jgi:squalene-associated FAD-dependent desaturase